MPPSGTAKLGLAAQSPTVNRLVQTMELIRLPTWINASTCSALPYLIVFVSFGSLS
jgi:hypothetical protein